MENNWNGLWFVTDSLFQIEVTNKWLQNAFRANGGVEKLMKLQVHFIVKIEYCQYKHSILNQTISKSDFGACCDDKNMCESNIVWFIEQINDLARIRFERFNVHASSMEYTHTHVCVCTMCPDFVSQPKLTASRIEIAHVTNINKRFGYHYE